MSEQYLYVRYRTDVDQESRVCVLGNFGEGSDTLCGSDLSDVKRPYVSTGTVYPGAKPLKRAKITCQQCIQIIETVLNLPEPILRQVKGRSHE